MTDGTKRLIKILALPFAIFMVYPIALGFKIYYALETHQPEIPRNMLVEYNYDKYKHDQNTGNRRIDSSLLTDDSGKVAFNAGENKIPVSFIDTESGKPVEAAKIFILFSRKATTNQNQEGSCATDVNGKCTLSINLPGKGYWDIEITGQDDGGKATVVTHIDF